MPKRPIEWLSAYESVSHRQQAYLNKVHQLRRDLQNKDEQLMMVAIERHRQLRGKRQDPRYPTMSKTHNKVMTFGPSPFPNRASNHQDRIKFHLAPSPTPNKLPPIIKGKQIIEPLDRNASDKDHESIEIIAKRNKLKFSYYNMNLSNSPTTRKTTDSPGRQMMRINKVSLHGPHTDVESIMSKQIAPMEYITDFSSRKMMYSGGGNGY